MKKFLTSAVAIATAIRIVAYAVSRARMNETVKLDDKQVM